VAEGLAAIHTLDVVHRDLKPSNILFDERGRAKISDLGLAQIPGGMSGRSQLGSLALSHPGTPAYMSPEQETAPGYLRPASDVYSLGIILFELLTGRHYKNLEPGTRARSLRAEAPDWLDELLAKMLADEPRQRPWNGEKAAGLLRSGLAQETARREAEEKARLEEEERLRLARLAAETARLAEEKARIEAESAARLAAAEQARREAEEKARRAEEERQRRARLTAETARLEAERRVKIEAEEKARHEAEANAARMAAEQAQRRSVEVAPEIPPKRLSGWPLAAIVVVGLIGLTFLLGKLLTSSPQSPAAPTETLRVTDTLSPTNTWTVTAPPTVTPVNTQPLTLGIGSTKISQLDGMNLMYVPAGNFLMGSDKNADPQADDDKLPQHTVYLDAFWIDQTLVTNTMFTLFIQAIGYQTDAEKGGWGWVFQNGNWSQVNGTNWQHPQGPGAGIQEIEAHPVVQVSWNDATAYCQWAGRRLPTEAEWEKAARGTDGRIYPWGNQAPDTTLANFNMNVGDTTNVGSYPSGASPYGALDMAGNVWEWVSDWYSAAFYQTSPSSNPVGPSSGDGRVLRGGSWFYDDGYVRAAIRLGNSPDRRSNDVGFRCAASP